MLLEELAAGRNGDMLLVWVFTEMSCSNLVVSWHSSVRWGFPHPLSFPFISSSFFVDIVACTGCSLWTLAFSVHSCCCVSHVPLPSCSYFSVVLYFLVIVPSNYIKKKGQHCNFRAIWEGRHDFLPHRRVREFQSVTGRAFSQVHMWIMHNSMEKLLPVFAAVTAMQY